MDRLDEIEKVLLDGGIDEAMASLGEYISSTDSPSDRAYYILGNAYRKKGDWQGAINNYLEAVHINPESPASGALKMAMEILEFYNKDMYNQ